MGASSATWHGTVAAAQAAATPRIIGSEPAAPAAQQRAPLAARDDGARHRIADDQRAGPRRLGRAGHVK